MEQGYCQLQTTKGNINVEIHCDIVPRMAENFLGLCGKGYYDGTKFHRSIRNFMLQVLMYLRLASIRRAPSRLATQSYA